MPELRVASFNIRNGRAFDGWRSWPFRRATTATAIDWLDADLLGLQEVFGFQLRGLLRQLGRYDAAGLGRDDGRRGEHSPVLYHRQRVRLLEHRTRWYGEEPDRPGSRWPGATFPRVATMCRLEVGGTAVVFVSTHLDARSAALRRRSAEQLASWLPVDVPVVVAADLNCDPASPPVQVLLDAGLRHALPPEAGGTEHGFTGRTDRRRIDHLLVGPGIEVLHAHVAHPRPGGRLPSDHWPVVAQLRLGDGRDTTERVPGLGR